MENITLGSAADFLTWLAGIAGALLILIRVLKKILNKLFEEQMEQVGEEIRAISDKIDKVDMDSCKNLLVRCLADVERGEPMTETEKERFYEQYEHYREHDGNSYIKQRVENLQREGKL